MKRRLAALFTALALLSGTLFAPVMASEPQQVVDSGHELQDSGVPAFSAELVLDGDVPGIYGTLSHIPLDTFSITVSYSFTGEDFQAVEDSDTYWDREWDLSGGENAPPLTQLCVGVNDHPLKAFLDKKVNSLYLQLNLWGLGGDTLTEVVKLTHGERWPIPEEPPAFRAGIELTGDGYVLKGSFSDFLPNTVKVIPQYSFDGTTYAPIGGNNGPMAWKLHFLGAEDEESLTPLQNQVCAYAAAEPMKSYLAQKRDRFFVRLQIVTDCGDTYETQSALVERGEPQPLPENATLMATFPSTMSAIERIRVPPYVFTYGKYNLTVRENTTPEELRALLPGTLPVEVRLLKSGTDSVLSSGIVPCKVDWKELPELSLTAGESLTLPDAANELVVPAGSKVVTPFGVYLLESPLAFDNPYARDEVRLVLNVIGAEEEPAVSLIADYADEESHVFQPLSLAFWHKPSGAESIQAYSYLDGGECWTDIGDLLQLRDVNANQSAPLYGNVELLRYNEAPYSDYLQGKIPGFLIGLEITGGIFDGALVVLPWPGEYIPPPGAPQFEGAGGNKGDVGGGGGDGSNGGQRPDLPFDPPTEDDIPTLPGKPDDLEPPGGDGTTPPETPVTPPDGGGTTPPETPDKPAIPDGGGSTLPITPGPSQNPARPNSKSDGWGQLPGTTALPAQGLVAEAALPSNTEPVSGTRTPGPLSQDTASPGGAVKKPVSSPPADPPPPAAAVSPEHKSDAAPLPSTPEVPRDTPRSGPTNAMAVLLVSGSVLAAAAGVLGSTASGAAGGKLAALLRKLFTR